MQNLCYLDDVVLPNYMTQIFKEQLTQLRSQFKKLCILSSVT